MPHDVTLATFFVDDVDEWEGLPIVGRPVLSQHRHMRAAGVDQSDHTVLHVRAELDVSLCTSVVPLLRLAGLNAFYDIPLHVLRQIARMPAVDAAEVSVPS